MSSPPGWFSSPLDCYYGNTRPSWDAAGTAEWVVVTRRTAYWRPEVRALVEQAPPVSVRARQGVWLSGLWHRPAAPTEKPGSSN